MFIMVVALKTVILGKDSIEQSFFYDIGNRKRAYDSSRDFRCCLTSIQDNVLHIYQLIICYHLMQSNWTVAQYNSQKCELGYWQKFIYPWLDDFPWPKD